MIGLRPEVLLSQRATSVSFDLCLLGKIEATNSATFIEIPVLLNITPSESFMIQVGPEFNFLAANKVTVEGETDSSTEGLNSFEIGLGVGLVYELSSGLNFGARYNLGMTVIGEEVEGSDYTEKYNWLQISIGYTFGK